MLRVINKVSIGPQFEYIISNRFSVSNTLFPQCASRAQSQQVQQAPTIYQVTAAKSTRERDETAQIACLISEREFTEHGTCGS